jgi:hypothetical protein
MAHTPGSVTSLPQAVVESLAEIVTNQALTFGHRVVLIARLLDPTLSVTDLARTVGCSRNVAAEALRRADSEHPRAESARSESARPAQKVRVSASRTRQRVTSLTYGENHIDHPSDDYVPPQRVEEGDDGAVEDLVLQSPPTEKPRRRSIAHGSGVSDAELATLAREVLRRRREDGLTTSTFWRDGKAQKLRAMMAGFLRDDVSPERLVAACSGSASLKSEAIAWQLNAPRCAEVKPVAQRKAPKYAASDDPEDEFVRAAAEAKANGYRSTLNG